MNNDKHERDPALRFSNRVDDYVRYRPGYPDEVLIVLQKYAGLTTDTVIADIGSGTGISSEVFLRNGNQVYAVEPNEPMRKAAEKQLGYYPWFHSIRGSAEATALPGGSIDLVVAAQAFHWFRPDETEQILDYEGLQGRVLSSSYIPAPGDAGYSRMLQELKRIFMKYNKNGYVQIEYDTELYFGEIASDT